MSVSEENPTEVAADEQGLLAPKAAPLSSLGRLVRVAGVSARGGLHALLGKLTGKPSDEREAKLLAQTVMALAELRGVPMKIGTLLSYAPLGIPEQTRAALSHLRSAAVAISLDEVRSIMRRELGVHAEPLLAALEPAPLVVGSMGQVHRSRLKDGTQVTVKVQYPGIAAAVVGDFAPATLGAQISSWFRREAQRRVLVREARVRMMECCDYQHEARRAAKFAEIFAGHPNILIPRVYNEYTTQLVLTSQYVPGLHLDELLATQPSQAERDRFGSAIFEYYFGSLFLSGLYNCDAHPGNYVFCSDGRVAFVDHGCTREFEPDFVRKLAALTRAVDIDRDARIHAAMVDLGIVESNVRYDADYAKRMLRWFFGPLRVAEEQAFPPDPETEFGRFSEDEKQVRNVAIPGELLFLLQMRVGLVYALSRLGTRANWAHLQRDVLERAAPSNLVYDVILVDQGARAIEVLREVRAALDLGLREAKLLTDEKGGVLARGWGLVAAEGLSMRLEDLGAKTEVREREREG